MVRCGDAPDLAFYGKEESEIMIEDIRKQLFSMQDVEYREFQSKLIPTVPYDTVIGVRTPKLRRYAKQLSKTEGISEFLKDLPHKYFDENQLHAFIISEIKDYETCMGEVERFLPYVDNWATCDQMSPGVFKKHKKELSEVICSWIKSEKIYTVRFGIEMLMKYFLEEDFCLEYPKMVAAVQSKEYYINMMIAWYFATALAKQYETVLPLIEEQCLDVWTHNKAIQKSVESYRITREKKEYLKSLKRKKDRIGS